MGEIDATRPPTPTDRRLAPVIRLAPAKLNLTLAVEGRRDDGFHDLHSVMVPLALADRLSLAAGTGPEDTLWTSGFDAGPLPANLVLRAIAEVRSAVGRAVPTPALAARLEKHIPVAAGLAGGSSDAAAAIDGALDAWSAADALDATALAELRRRVAARVGSDVPFFLAGTAAVVAGRGERVETLPALRGTAPGVLLVTPDVRVSTAAVFAALDTEPAAAPRDPRSTRASSEHLATEWRAGFGSSALLDRAGILASANDLAEAADLSLPGLRSLRRALVRELRRPVGLSGSGPTLWVLYASATEAADAADVVRAGLAEGAIVAPGEGRPSIVATTIDAAPAAPNPGLEQEGPA
jgi:4-diphosphocytidyl-2-C-methyl-D-erythritol kinase